ncbi:MAG: hypothetical protein Alpg2KO_06140 [Alphaproteobacteria bacterium]
MPVLTVNNQSKDDAELKPMVKEEHKASFQVYSFGNEARDGFPEASGRLGDFFAKSGRMGQYIAREGWNSFNEIIRDVGENVQEMAFKVTSTRAGSIALGVAGGLGLMALYKMAPNGGVVSDVAAGAGGALTVVSGVLAGHRGIVNGAAGANATEEIMNDRARGWGDDKAEWSDYGDLKDAHMDPRFVSPDHPSHDEYLASEDADKNWFTQSASFFGKIQIPVAAASIAMWGTGPKGLLIVSAAAFGPELLGRGIGAISSASHLARDGMRQVGEYIDSVREGKDDTPDQPLGPHSAPSGGGGQFVSFQMEEEEPDEELEEKKKKNRELRMRPGYKPGDPDLIG